MDKFDIIPSVMKVLDYISQGYTETTACDKEGISPGAFRKVIKESPQFQEMYEEAFMRGTDAMADALLNPDNHALYGHSDAKMARVQSENIKWFLSKRRPKDFGDKIEVTHNITADKAIIQALSSAKQRLISGGVIDAEFEPDDQQLMIEMGLAEPSHI